MQQKKKETNYKSKIYFIRIRWNNTALRSRFVHFIMLKSESLFCKSKCKRMN